ncbi:TIGR03767 family metallophosphoesterase [soil metagenome]
MAGLSRRQFISIVGALAAASAIPVDVLGRSLSVAAAPAEAPSTLLRTILQGRVLSGSYRTLTAGPGEPYLPRTDILRAAPSASRVAARRSLLYLGHLSDLHVIDAQSPGRIEPMIVQDHSAWGSAFHPQDPLSPHATSAMIKAVSDLRFSPLTGAPMSATIVTGDSADMHSHNELRWYIDLLDGLSVDPRTSSAFEGVQAWADAVWAYRPTDPAGGAFGAYGFPKLPKLLDQAIAQPVESVGLPSPWYTVYGNHETLLLGTFDIDSQLSALATGGKKAYTLEATAGMALGGYAASTTAVQRSLDALAIQAGLRPGFRSVEADASRYLFRNEEFMAEHFTTEPTPGPVGHGFTQHNLDTGETWWMTDLSPTVRAFGLDTCNQVAGPDGAVPDVQFQWLKAQLELAQRDNKLVLIFSHHNSDTLENRAQRPWQNEVLHGADEFVAMLLQYPVVVGWLNGHTHLNQILAHRGDRGGFWEITTASCVDFPQQQQVVELVDNRDGTLSIFTTVVDHASDPEPGSGGDLFSLASRSRELASNDWAETPLMRRGSALDRNTELLLPAPFDLSAISDAALEAQHLAERTRILAYEAGLR